MLDLVDGVRVAPHLGEVVVVDVHRGGHDPEAGPVGLGHGSSSVHSRAVVVQGLGAKGVGGCDPARGGGYAPRSEERVHITVAENLSTLSTTRPEPQPRARRSDAERNRTKILRAAREAFVDGGSDVSMAEISRRAGVGMATLYRNFSGRRELLEALYATEVDVVCDAAKSADGSPPEVALRAWLVQFFAFITGKKHVAAELLTHVDHESPLFNDSRDRVLAAGRPLFDAAQAAGAVRGDLGFGQVLDLLVSLASIDGDARYRDPILQTVLDGLSPPEDRR